MNTNKKHLPSTLTNEGKVSEIVRCKECKHNVANWQHDELDGTDYTDIVCDYFMTDGMDKNDFCSRGEKLLINENKSNNFDVKSNNEIEEMAKAIHEVENLEWLEDTLAEHLYNAGYRKQSEWISVEERLPDKYESVLIFVEGEIRLDYIDGYGTWHENFLYRVTHWMPLPEAPKMTRKEDERK